MSERSRAAKAPAGDGTTPQDATKPECGVIMPISATATHSEDHWRKVQVLLHRGISMANFTPRNVWESATSDRISERIIGSLFEVPIAVADISDLNPNVMLELGLRLASKKPTVVIANAGGEIPFDIRDFHATFYPPDLNILDMEDFFRKFGRVLQEKYEAYSKGDVYTPFLGNVIVDVASPETREVGVNEFLINRLDEIGARLVGLESSLRRTRSTSTPTPGGGRARIQGGDINGVIAVEIPDGNVKAFTNEAISLFEVDNILKRSESFGIATLDVLYSAATSQQKMQEVLGDMAKKYGGYLELPF